MNSKNGSSVGPSVFVPELHPELKQIGRSAIHIFLKERERYLLRAADATAQASTFKPVSLVSSIDIDLLESLIDFDTFPGVTNRAELAEEVLLRWLQAQVVSVLDCFTPKELDGMVKKNVRIKLHEPDPKLRMMALFTDYKTFLRNKKLESLTTENTEVAVRHVCGLLRPPTLRKKIENDLALHRPSLKKDWQGFYKHVVENAVACEQFVPCTEKNTLASPSTRAHEKAALTGGHRGPHNRVARSHSRDKLFPGSPGKWDTGLKSSSSTKYPSPRQDSNSLQNDSEKKLLPLCLNTKTCPDERHYIKKCPKSTPEEKRLLLEEYLRTRPRPTSALKHISWSGSTDIATATSTTASLNGRIRALLTDIVPVVVKPFYQQVNHRRFSRKFTLRMKVHLRL